MPPAAATRARELTPPGAGGVSVLRIEGPAALERVRSLAPDLRARLEVGAGPTLVRLADAGEDLDEALCIVLDECSLELHLHGSPPLVARVRELLDGGAGDDPTSPRSLEDRAEHLLASAPSEAGARILLDQVQGALRRDLEALVPLADEACARALAPLLERGRVAAPALVPARVVLAGPANAGKSTLFNALFGRERVIVSTAEGTTRDAVFERASFGAYPVDLIDTAGERDVPSLEAGTGAVGEVEREGQSLGRALRGTADLVLWLCPADGPPGDPPPGAVLIRSRIDLDPHPAPGGLSAATAPEAAARVCAARFREHLRLPEDPWQRAAGVPFDDELRRRLGALGAGATSADRRRALDDLLRR